MSYRIGKVMVIGAGVMGAGIAAHLANADVRVYLVDIVPSKLTAEEWEKGLTLDSPQVRNRIVEQGLRFLKNSRPPKLFSPTKLDLITIGNTEDNFDWANHVDWIIEVVLENLDIKRQVMARIDKTRKVGSIVSTNTSGIPVSKIAEGRSEDFKRHFLGTHFFNPVRYLKLLELIPTTDTDSLVLNSVKSFGERRLGKTVVICKDSPNFIANRVGVVTGRANLNFILEQGYTIEEVDAIFGHLIGRPKTAIFRLLDLVGMDVNKQVTNNLYKAIPHDPGREVLRGKGSTLIDKMVESGLLGNKVGKGFYRKTRDSDGKLSYQVLDLKTLEYRDQEKPLIPIIEEAAKINTLCERLKFLYKQENRLSKLIWYNLASYFSYCSKLVPEIADHLYAIDDAVRAGFSHEMGPFELWDNLGVGDILRRMEADGFTVAPWVKEMIHEGGECFYKQTKDGNLYWDLHSRSYKPIPVDPYVLVLTDRKQKAVVIAENPSASLIDIGDGVLCLEFHSKANALDQEIQTLCDRALDILEGDHIGLVIGNQGKNFSAGTDISRIVSSIESKQWSTLEGAIKDIQNRLLRLRYFAKPVVAAPFGQTIGGGAEVAMAADRICASAETYMGLVQVSLGLIPASGGCVAMLKRLVSPAMRIANTDALPFLQKAFENIVMAKVSQSAFHAKEMGFLTEKDRLVMNGDYLLNEAKSLVLEMHAAGYVPPLLTRSVYALGERGFTYLMQAAQIRLWGGYITVHDNVIARKLAYVLAGGPLSVPQWVDEQYILDLEREACLSLLGEAKTFDRIKHMLTTGKSLRN